MDISKLTDWLKLSPKYLFPISLATGFLVFAPVNLLELFGLVAFVSQYKPYIGVAFLLSASLLLSSWLTGLGGWVLDRVRESKALRSGKKRLHNLTEEEQKILRRYILKKTRTQYLNVDDGVASGLVSAGVIYRSSNVGRLTVFPFNIQPWAWKYLNEHPKLLSSSEDKN